LTGERYAVVYASVNLCFFDFFSARKRLSIWT
jgi:hypothetical protein